MPGVAYADYAHARLIVLWGVNPSATGIHLVPVHAARRAQAARRCRRRSAAHAARRRPTCTSAAAAGHRPAGRARAAPLAVRATALADHAFLARARDRRRRAARARRAVDDRARRRRSPASSRETLERVRRALRRRPSPAVIRCGWGLERNRNGGRAVAAVLALPAVAGKFGVRGGGYTMSNSARAGDERPRLDRRPTPPATRIVNMNRARARRSRRCGDPPIEVLFVYNANPVATIPDQNAVRAGPRARGPVHRRVRAGHDRHGARTPTWCCRRRRSSSTTTCARLRRDRAAAASSRSSRRSASRGRTTRCSASCATASGLSDGPAEDETETLFARRAAAARRRRARRARRRRGPCRPAATAAGPVRRRAPAHRRRQDPPVPRRRSTRGAAAASTATRPIPATGDYPLALISPASDEDDQLDVRPAADTRRRCCTCTPTMPPRAASPPAMPSACSTRSARCTAWSR